MTSLDQSEPPSELHAFALNKIAKVLGQDRAAQLTEKMLGELRLELRTPDDLLRLSEAMTPLGGFESAVGGMLGVAAVLRGAGAAKERRTPPTNLERFTG